MTQESEATASGSGEFTLNGTGQQVLNDRVPVNLTALTKILSRHLRLSRSSLSSEMRIHGVIAGALTEAMISFVREHRFSLEDRADFFLPNSALAIEVKKDALTQSDLRQIGRYLAHTKCRGCIAIGLRANGIPAEFLGKPIYLIELWKLLL